MFTGLGKLPSHFNFDLKISPEFPRGFSFHLQPKFPRGFPPQTTTILGDSSWNPRDFARWVGIYYSGVISPSEMLLYISKLDIIGVPRLAHVVIIKITNL